MNCNFHGINKINSSNGFDIFKEAFDNHRASRFDVAQNPIWGTYFYNNRCFFYLNHFYQRQTIDAPRYKWFSFSINVNGNFSSNLYRPSRRLHNKGFLLVVYWVSSKFRIMRKICYCNSVCFEMLSQIFDRLSLKETTSNSQKQANPIDKPIGVDVQFTIICMIFNCSSFP